jgi:hypothetical protein
MNQKSAYFAITIIISIIAASSFFFTSSDARPCAFRPCDPDGRDLFLVVANLTGSEEIPFARSEGQGKALFWMPVTMMDNAIYSVNFTGLDNVNQAHVHNGSEGENGPIILTLFNKDDPIWADYPYSVNGSSVIEGTFNATEFEGPYEGKTMEEFTNALRNGDLYVNVHTQEYPTGELRGQTRENR